MILHDSRDAFYRDPQGAQPCGTKIRFRLRCDEQVSAIWLRLWWDNREIKLAMTRRSPDVYSADFPLPKLPGLLWYHFVLEGKDGRIRYYGNAADHMGGEGLSSGHEPPGYQLTVYDPDYKAPRWLADSVMYHIMVDRFCASRPVSERPAPAHGHWHLDWNEPPELTIDAVTADNMADDFFGGDLMGVQQKLPYLHELGVTVLYLSPIFQSRSNHKYNVGDYKRIDPSFGTERDFERLCRAARALGMRVVLDGVFSHTGADSRYFNKHGNYDSVGAFQSKDSPYYSWYDFKRWPHDYESWWGFDTLPCVRELAAGYMDFMFKGEDAVSARWIAKGASGWRLDVADELPMPFLRELRRRVKQEDGDGAVLGEVWEDASCKLAYDELRCYCLGDTLDSVMNYPLREMIFDFLLGRATAGQLARRLSFMKENYPPTFFYSLMNLLGSHDKARAISVLSGAFEMEPPRGRRSAKKLAPADYKRGRKRFLMAWQLVCALPGMPSLYYADEAGATGMADPFCRGAYPWGREDEALLSAVRKITRTRGGSPVWTRGELSLSAPTDDLLLVVRQIAGGKDALGEPAANARALCAVNRGGKKAGFVFDGVMHTVPALSAICIEA